MMPVAVALAVLAGHAVGAMEITAPADRLFTAGTAPRVKVAGRTGALDWTVTDYFGRETARGSVPAGGETAAFDLPTLGPGWYRVACRDAAGAAARAELGVVLDRRGARLPAEGKVAGDAASAWLLPRRTAEDFRAFAADVARAGIPWVRERLRWAEVEPEPGRFAWGRYDLAAQALAGAGIRICQVWHDSPGWSHPGDPEAPCPDDLREVYRFARAAASRFKGRIQAWEIWNEPDIHFWRDLGDRYAGFLKAAALGLREGDARAVVLAGSLCSGDTAFARAVMAQGVLAYCDAFNWHSYKPPSEYVGELGEYRRLAASAGVDLPAPWITEAGIRRPGTMGAGGRELDDPALRDQARYVPRSVVRSLAAGNARHFFFVLPDYLERGTQFGARRPDGSPHPALVALSAAANLLGTAEYLGRLPDERAEVHAFGAGRRTVLVLWADAPVAVPVPTDRKSIEVTDLFGAPRTGAARNGTAMVEAGPDAVYVRDAGGTVGSRLTDRPARRPAIRARRRPPPVVVSGFARLPFVKERNAYVLPAAAATASGFAYAVEVVNLDAKRPAAGSVNLVLPAGWRAEGVRREFTLGPMDRLAYEVSILPSGAGLETVRVRIEARSGKDEVPPAISEFQQDAGALAELEARVLGWDDAAGWSATRAGDEIATVEPAEAGRFRIAGRRVAGGGECWWEVERRLAAPLDLSGFDGIACELAGEAGEGDAYVYLMLAGPGGTFRSTGGACGRETRTVRFLFRDLGGGTDGLAAAARIKIGVWAGGGRADVEAGRFRLVRLTRP